MSDLEVVLPRIEGWQIVNPVPVYFEEERVGDAIVELTDDPKTLLAKVTLDDVEVAADLVGARFGLNGQITRSHDRDGVTVVDEVRVGRLVVG